MEAAHGSMKESSPWGVPIWGRVSDKPTAASDLELAQESWYQLVSRALTGFLEEVGAGRVMTHPCAKMISPRTQSCTVAPGASRQGVCGGDIPAFLPCRTASEVSSPKVSLVPQTVFDTAGCL